MKTVLSGLVAAAFASLATVLPVPANSAPVAGAVPDAAHGYVVNVESGRNWERPRTQRKWVQRRHARWERRRAWRRDRYYDDGYYDRRYYDDGYYGEPVYRSYREYRPRRYYRRHRPGVTLEFNLD